MRAEITVDRHRFYCPQCHHNHSFAHAGPNHGLHFALCILTCGLWLIPWLSLTIGAMLFPWRCRCCGWSMPQPRHARIRLVKPVRSGGTRKAGGRNRVHPGFNGARLFPGKAT